MFRRSICKVLTQTPVGRSPLNISDVLTNVQSVRWRRKPRWLPMAKSKMFRVPERKIQDPDEKQELQRLHNIYRTEMRSVMSHFRSEYNLKYRVSAVQDKQSEQIEDAEFQACMAINDEWNSNIAAMRELRLKNDMTERKEFIEGRLEAKITRDIETMEFVEAKVRQEKEASKYFITRENLDEAIERALANPTDHNFAIDLQGNMHSGRNDSLADNVANEAKKVAAE